jgi:predicted Zn-dependent protease
MKKIVYWMFVVTSLISCDENNNFVIFSVSDDVNLGAQVSAEIAKDPTYKLLSPQQYAGVYTYLNGLRDAILNSGEIAYKNEFKWELHVIQNDTVLNAFATPGGYIYVYTGLIKYLDEADALEGVLGHEMAHADLRHSVRNLQKMYGVQILLNVALGNDPNSLAQIVGQVAGSLAGLKFSRDYETDADSHSVEYLAHTRYACNGAARFFIKLSAQANSSDPPEFLSTHPNPENRIEKINNKAKELNCSTALSGDTEFQKMKNSLPN